MFIHNTLLYKILATLKFSEFGDFFLKIAKLKCTKIKCY